MTPAALEKAECLYKFALGSGAPVSTFELLLTLGEGYELLDWLPKAGLTAREFIPMLQQDIAEAKLLGDPWLVLNHFTLKGLHIRRVDTLVWH